jgi:hypothetical protein
VLEIAGLPAGEYVLWKRFPFIAPVVIRIGTPLDPSGSGSDKYVGRGEREREEKERERGT